jgi:molecular chaperone DnaK
MTNYVGIDLGTTNSAICSYDGDEITLYKSPEQTDVTPSAIFVDRRGNKFVGNRAYNDAARAPDNVAKEFKRMMGTSTPISLKAVNLTMTPEQCSSEILKTLFGYLPEEIRNDPDVGTVITVPAAFNQMQKDATMEAAQSAAIGRVALMQEPVAAVMSVMRKRRGDGIFLVYDIGGGTLDIAIAQSIGGRVSLLGQGGIPMCGGRDFDRSIVNNVVMPWLMDHFDLPNDFVSLAEFIRVRRMAEYAAERAKIELSKNEEAIIAASESDISVRDFSGKEIYLDCPVTRSVLDILIDEKVGESIEASRDAIAKASLTAHDIERIVFVGGPSQYKPLRERVSFELGVAASTEVRPMTAVAEGAAVFAESIDWTNQSRARKSVRGTVSAGGSMNITLNYASRTPDTKAKVGLKLGATPLPDSEFQIDSLDTGWSSGRLELRDGAIVEVPLSKSGPHLFKVFVFDPRGGPISLNQEQIVISRIAATVDAIPASHSIGIEVRDKIGGAVVLDYLIREGGQLPAKGQKLFKAGESLRAGSSGSLNFIIREGEIEHPISDNRFVGVFKITGNDFDDNVITAGSDLVCDYEILDSGNIVLDVSVPSIGASFTSGKNFYSRLEAEIDYTNAAQRVLDDAARISEQVSDIEKRVDGSALGAARERLNRAMAIAPEETNPEAAKQAMEDVQKAKELLAKVRKANLKVMRRAELDRLVYQFNEAIRRFAKPSEETSFDMLVKRAELAIGDPRPDFEAFAGQLQSKILGILIRQDWFIVDRFNWYAEAPHLFADANLHARLVAVGKRALADGDAEQVRKVVYEMDLSRISSPEADDMLAASNLVRG